jgi:uncharacterized protein with HEPN domain
MRDACLKVQQYAAGFTWELFDSDSRTQDAVIRQLEIIGEASSRLSQECKDSNDFIPWRAVKAFRNVAIHDYDRVMPDRIWKLTCKDIPEMINQLEALIERHKE